jgi:atypical dual specificity phosphatase
MSLVLELDGYGVAFGERVVLASVDLEIPSRGMLVLIGPGGVGKSTLLRTISGANDNNPSLRTWGRALFAGAPLGMGERPALLAQKAKLLMGTVLENLMAGVADRGAMTPREQAERARHLLDRAGLVELGQSLAERVIGLPLGLQRRLSIARTTVTEPRLLCVDEPTTDLTEAEAEAVIALLRWEAERRAVIFTTHNQRHARAAGGITALLAGGRIHEIAPTHELFSAPLTRAAQQLVRTGSCDVPSPGARPEDLAEGVPPSPPLPAAARAVLNDAYGPRGFRWLIRGALGGTPRPGIVDDRTRDLEALRRVGVTVLVTLELERPSPEELGQFGLKSVFFPIPDMQAPHIDAAREHCQAIADLLAAGEVVAFHCRAGLGRTGTMLAAQLVRDGATAVAALEAVRRVEPHWVQSNEQIAFLEHFERALRGAPQGT